MTELRNIQADLSRFRLRVLIIAIVVVIAFGLVAALQLHAALLQ